MWESLRYYYSIDTNIRPRVSLSLSLSLSLSKGHDMTTVNPKYRNLEDIKLEELAQLMQLVEDRGISPATLLSYAFVLDAVENAKDDNVSVQEALEMNYEAESDDGCLVDDLYYDAKLILIKMGKT